ncbi:hypothetical protein IFM89_023926 [Coptis chinensis]|uniref:Thionin-like protein 2 n=1 Tax=Coptis chinensis TaxID=261450 RepID=A0A835I146_9MAGN|nr:hypothetical protein IFM89_023926 [Coptis chinensis]
MEGKSLRALLVMFIVMIGMGAGQTYAASTNSFAACYGECFLLRGSVLKCLARCIFSRHPTSDIHYYCNLGCASSKCTSISTLQNPREDAVKDCVNSCSDICKKHQ